MITREWWFSRVNVEDSSSNAGQRNSIYVLSHVGNNAALHKLRVPFEGLSNVVLPLRSKGSIKRLGEVIFVCDTKTLEHYLQKCLNLYICRHYWKPLSSTCKTSQPTQLWAYLRTLSIRKNPNSTFFYALNLKFHIERQVRAPLYSLAAPSRCIQRSPMSIHISEKNPNKITTTYTRPLANNEQVPAKW